MKVIIAGGRDYSLTEDDIAWLDGFASHDPGISEVVSGGAKGADFDGEIWAKMRGIPLKRFVADWQKHGKAAGPIRNRQMAEYADALIAFPGGAGTRNMISEARKRSLYIWDKSEQPVGEVKGL